jgi:transposase InsO family protein
LSVIDDHNRYLIALEATARPEGALVHSHLEHAFIECGLPDAMLMDHGIPWWNWQSFAGSTQLSLWLMRQGIRLCFSGIRHPQMQGKVERFHGRMERALNHRGVPEGAWTLKIDSHGTIDIHDQSYHIAKPLIGERFAENQPPEA